MHEGLTSRVQVWLFKGDEAALQGPMMTVTSNVYDDYQKHGSAPYDIFVAQVVWAKLLEAINARDATSGGMSNMHEGEDSGDAADDDDDLQDEGDDEMDSN